MTLCARQEAIYTLWRLKDLRAEQLFIQVAGSVDMEEEYTRHMATEALGNTSRRPGNLLGCLRRSLEAKLSDPASVDDNRMIAEHASKLLG